MPEGGAKRATPTRPSPTRLRVVGKHFKKSRSGLEVERLRTIKLKKVLLSGRRVLFNGGIQLQPSDWIFQI